ncbi:MAG: peptidase [Sphingomonadales bacterium 32-64-17]|nr:MAG: peptidase [Sphingomonadales bacterium 32-64-17]
MPETAAPSASSASAMLPLFYKALQPLHSVAHADWRLKPGDVSFAADTPFLPIVASEIIAAARNYPVVFAGDTAQPIVVLALEATNLFVEDGKWSNDCYIPAYVRRYPFAFVATQEPQGFVLSVDSGSDRVTQGGTEGTPLFEDGKPSTLTQQALEFCTAFGREAELTKLFTDALREKELLIDRRADATLPDGRKLGLHNFQIIDAQKFAALDDKTIVAWHRQGLLALAHHHLASLDRFRELVNRQALHPVTGSSLSPASPKPVVAEGDAPAKSAKSRKVTS